MLHNVFTNPSLLIPSLLFPLFFFTAFAGGLSRDRRTCRASTTRGGYTAFQFVFVLLQSAAFGGVFTGFGIARDFESGFARRLLLAAPHRSGIVLGYAAAALVRWLVTAAVLTVVALLVGMNVGGSGVDLVGLYTLAIFLNLAAMLWAARRRAAPPNDAGRARSCRCPSSFSSSSRRSTSRSPCWRGGSTLSRRATRSRGCSRRAAAFWRGPRPRSGSRSRSRAALVLGFSLWALRGLRSAEHAG